MTEPGMPAQSNAAKTMSKTLLSVSAQGRHRHDLPRCCEGGEREFLHVQRQNAKDHGDFC